jgi:hypothetical protein
MAMLMKKASASGAIAKRQSVAARAAARPLW